MAASRSDKVKVPLRRKSRELALQVLYQAELAGLDPVDAFDIYIGHFDANKRALEYARRLVVGVEERLAEIDELLQQHSANWRLSRMAVVDRNIMRIAAFEMLHEADVPPQVAINEALEVARRFSSDDAVPFINGILDAIDKHRRSQDESAAAAADAPAAGVTIQNDEP